MGGIDESPEEEPTSGKISEITKFTKERQIKTIFFETLVSPRIAENITKESGAKTAGLNPIQGLTDEEQADHLDYIAVMKNNLDELKKALNE